MVTSPTASSVDFTAVAALIIGAARIFALLGIFPIFSLFNVIGLLRVVVSIGLSSPLILLVYEHLHHDPQGIAWLCVLAFKEFALGWCLGTVLGLPFWAAQAAGDMTDVYRGANQANIFDQINVLETTPLGTILLSSALVMFVASGGLLGMLGVVFHSFTFWPAISLRPVVEGDLRATVLDFLSDHFHTGPVLAMPLVALLGVIELAIGFVGRSSKQFHLNDSVQVLKNIALSGAVIVYASFVPTYFHMTWGSQIGALTTMFGSAHGQER